MQRSGGGASSSAPGMTIFAGVRFVLFGFDSVSEAQYRAEIVRRGGTDVGKYDHSCTHVIVSGRTYDDPVCVAAREDGKTLVTEMWIDDSVDFGVLADAARMLYRPVRNLNGIPGSESLHICLTGYQKQERDDIMKLVSLMGAKFSKPLIANQVTHLVCYKFEGEKYELARKVNIKLVNHRWLEDCLKEWEILPTDNYTKSGWELEILEAEAEDSEEETVEVGTKSLRHRSSVGTSTVGNGKSVLMISDLSTPLTGKVQKNMTVANQSVAADHHVRSNVLLMTPSKASSSGKELEACNLVREEVFQSSDDTKICAMDDGISFIPCNSNIKEGGTPSSTKLSSTSSIIGKKLNSLSYSRKSDKKSVSPELSTNFKCSPQVSVKESMSKVDFDISLLAPIEGQTSHEPLKNQSPNANVKIYLGDASSGSLPQKRKVSPSQVGSKSPRMEYQNLKTSTLDSPQQGIKVQEAKHSTISPHGGDNMTLGEADQSVQEVGFSDLSEKMQVNPSKSKLCYRNSTTRRKSVTGTENSVFSSSEIGNSDNSGMKQGMGGQKTGMTNPATLEPVATGFTPPACSKVLPILSDDDLLLVGSMHENMSSAKCDFGSLATSGKLDDVTSGKDKGPDAFSGSTGGQNPTTRDYDQIANGETPNCINEGLASRCIIRKQERVLSSNSMEEKKTSVTASNMLEESNKQIIPATRIKKTVAKKSTTGRTKISTATTVVNVEDQDKAVARHEPAVENGVLRIIKAKSVNSETGKNLMQEEGELFHEDDISHIKNTVAKRTGGITKLTTASSKEGIVAYSDKTATTSEPAVENGNFRDMDSKPSGDETRNNLMDEQGELFPEDVIMEDAIQTKKKVGKKSTKGRTKSSTVSSKEGNVTDSNKTVITNNHAVESGKFKNMKAKPVHKEIRKNSTAEYDELFPDNVIMENSMEDTNHLVTAGECKDATVDGIDISKDSEKENMPCDSVPNSDSTTNHPKKIKKRGKQPFQNPNSSRMQETSGKVCRLGPANFILSGHRIQKKEFQTAIRRLRGRVCRDSHQWSYQATHFIAPYPVRRTEKFFAAAAAGRWILKPDYLTASNEAGNFLDEEPFEVYDKGLTEDGTISLEAPRKWRLLRERTGHGAFYGMRIIIYGECIAPTLDTMKRVVKAGDGTILATSPPYTRFLRSGVDYAVVSPSMLRVDSWVQEFLRHNIPCVTTDYLVEYVCKPGYSLEKHVLFRTHSWAEKSFANLLSRSEEVIKDVIVSDDSIGDLNCAVCGQSDRGEVMLICGNEAGSTGCGIGTHIDCCDPPLESVPEGDWFCSKCTGAFNKTVKSTSRRK